MNPSVATTDLNNDALQAPEAPALDLAAKVGTLLLSWQGGDTATTASIYRYDDLTGREELIADRLDNQPGINTLHVQSNTHRTAWHRQQYRVELCGIDDCVSSLRVSTAGLAAETTQALSPSVFLQSERYGEQLASNEDASLLAISLPLQGAVDLQLRTENRWTSTQRVQLPGLGQSSSRHLKIALSASGDTMAVLVMDAATEHSVRLLERLGEAWIETAAYELAQTTFTSDTALSTSDSDTMTGSDVFLSDDENRVSVRWFSRVWIFERAADGWPNQVSELFVLTANDHKTASVDPVSSRATLAATSNRLGNRIQSIEKAAGKLWLNDWQRGGSSSDPDGWVLASRTAVEGLNPDRQALLLSNRSGERVVIVGWEPTQPLYQTPVMWRYQMPVSQSGSSNQSMPVVLDSLRQKPVEEPDASLTLAADGSLDTIAFGWQAAEPTQTGGIAELTTYTYAQQLQRWLPALELPEAMPVLAKSLFASHALIAADGATMLLSDQPTHAASAGNTAGQILVFR